MRHARDAIRRATRLLRPPAAAERASTSASSTTASRSRRANVVRPAPSSLGAHRGSDVTSRRFAWTGVGGPARGDGSRVGRHDERPPPPPLCGSCGRRFCECEHAVPVEPPYPGPEDCCQSSPQCKFCVWTTYASQLEAYEARLKLVRETKDTA